MPGEGSTNTTYIAGHSYDKVELPFNKLSDPTLVGEELEVETVDGTLDYVVDSVTTYEKDTLKDSEIWRIVPNRIVLISCYTQDAVGKNVVVTASPAA
jgi:LPXTG-site transpeptidase (sortase) family protein